jgi:hypothetical protein
VGELDATNAKMAKRLTGKSLDVTPAPKPQTKWGEKQDGKNSKAPSGF